jgi:hypothetical protein
MKLAGDYLFEASVAEVWSALFDPVILAAVMPGCEKLDLVDGQYVGEIKVKVGPIQGNFTGKVDLKDKAEPHSYTMIVDGRGASGFVKATAAVRLAPEGPATRVSYDTDAQIGGKIASVGQRLIEASARAIVAQSLEGLHTNIKLRAVAYRDAGANQAVAGPATATPDATPAPAPVAAASEPVIAPATAVVSSEPAPANATAEPGKPVDAVAFTPVKVKQSDLANAVAKEVASSLFPRSVLVAIILIQALVIVWLLLRH